MGICVDCRCLTRFLFRFRDDGTMDSLVGHQWKQFQFQDDRTWWQRVRDWLR